ncbi:MAG: 16S rRNA (uracil(1498)-N(3))-methyltransferase [Pseudomonadota bacterium]
MAQTTVKIRLYVAADLGEDREISLDRDQAHYLFAVMRQSVGRHLLLFNGRDGEWLAEVVESAKRGGRLRTVEQLHAQTMPPDLWLAFAPLKKARTDFVAEKACEMGCRRLVPVFTRHTNSERINLDRLRAHAVEAAEQCGLLSVPEMADAMPLDGFLRKLGERWLMFCDESGSAPPAREALRGAGPGPWAVLIGPEGGFDPAEAARLRALPNAVPVSLGPRILRADTAAVAALALWQSVLGDWGETPG